uniref:Uncharacterized protein n=1 Tax=Anguilla anguilla TaxID=7936 RepID=A0A0E9WCJ4_ANGAN
MSCRQFVVHTLVLLISNTRWQRYTVKTH